MPPEWTWWVSRWCLPYSSPRGVCEEDADLEWGTWVNTHSEQPSMSWTLVGPVLLIRWVDCKLFRGTWSVWKLQQGRKRPGSLEAASITEFTSADTSGLLPFWDPIAQERVGILSLSSVKPSFMSPVKEAPEYLQFEQYVYPISPNVYPKLSLSEWGCVMNMPRSKFFGWS